MSAHSKDEGLRECPFCGAFPISVGGRGLPFHPSQSHCTLRGHVINDPPAWNRRSSSAAERGMRAVLEKAAAQFESYAREHSAKANAATARNALGDADIAMSKARTNTACAEMCRAALSARAGEGDEQS